MIEAVDMNEEISNNEGGVSLSAEEHNAHGLHFTIFMSRSFKFYISIHVIWPDNHSAKIF